MSHKRRQSEEKDMLKKQEMEQAFEAIETPYVDAQTLLTLFSGYDKPRERILRMVKNGELMRLKNGFYLLADRVPSSRHRANPLPYEQIANMLYGPSYVSLEWALSFYGMIPERVYTVTSVTLGRNKQFTTPIGDFSYCAIAEDKYAMGVTLKDAVHTPGSFFIASPEKALADLVFRRCRNLTPEEMLRELTDSLRIPEESLRTLDKDLMNQICECYHSKSINTLAKIITK